MKICVYASSSPNTPHEYLQVAKELGRLCAMGNHIVVNGAGNTGCMGALNDACLEHGGRVEGVILRKFHEENLGHSGLHDLKITDTMRERKRLLSQESEAFIALPGGPGTWEELWELAVERQIQSHDKPLILINYNDFYRGFLVQLERAEADGLLYGPASDLMHFVDTAEHALNFIKAY